MNLMSLFNLFHAASSQGSHLAVSHQQDRIQKRIAAATKRLAEMAEEDSDDKWSASLRDHLQMWENKRDFYNLLISMDFLPGDVVSDGNCGIWSLRGLECGCFVQTALTTPARVQAMREDLQGNHWGVGLHFVAFIQKASFL